MNRGLIKSEVFPEKIIFPFEPSLRYKRFASCMESFCRNYIRLQRLLDSIAAHLNITYKGRNEKQVGQYQVVKESINLENDLMMFFVVVKILLDDVAFFTPFYYKTPIIKNKKDVRDSKWAWSFGDMTTYFLENKTYDNDFSIMLCKEESWTNEVCRIRRFLMHNFHDLSLHQDYWSNACCVFLWTFNTKKDFIPNVTTYIAKIYYKLVRFLKQYDIFFKEKCEVQFKSFEYFYAGVTVAGGINRTHLFWGGLGRLIENAILIRIHPKRRNQVIPLLEKLLKEENVACVECNGYNVKIQPTVEHFVRISATCKCGSVLNIPIIVEKKFYPYFMDQNNQHSLYGLIPYTLDKN